MQIGWKTCGAGPWVTRSRTGRQTSTLCMMTITANTAPAAPIAAAPRWIAGSRRTASVRTADPAASNRSDATCTAQPLTYPDGSSPPAAWMSKYPSVSRHRSAQAASTSVTSGDASAAGSVPAAIRLISLVSL